MDEEVKPKTPFWNNPKVIITAAAIGTAAIVGLVVKNAVDIHHLNYAAGANNATIDIILNMLQDEGIIQNLKVGE